MMGLQKRLTFALLISLFILVGFAKPAYAVPISFVTSQIATGDVSTTPTMSVNAGDTVIAIAGAQAASVALTDSESNSPTLVNTKVDSGATVFEQMSYFTVATTSTTYTVTATFSCGGCTANRNSLVVLVYRGVT